MSYAEPRPTWSRLGKLMMRMDEIRYDMGAGAMRADEWFEFQAALAEQAELRRRIRKHVDGSQP